MCVLGFSAQTLQVTRAGEAKGLILKQGWRSI